MSSQSNKALAIQFFDKIDAGNFDAAFALMSDDATWWFPTDTPGGLKLSKEAMRGAIAGFEKAFKTAPQMERGRITAEDDRVCIEQQSRGGVTHGGATYANDYHILMVVRDGEISEVREYMNPMLGQALMAEMQSQA
jgi:ketosteroid isomerase-like protein